MDKYIIIDLPVTDFLYLAAALDSERISKLNLIDKILKKRYRKKLLKALDKLNRNNIILTKKSVEELLGIMYLDNEDVPEQISDVKTVELHSGFCYMCNISFSWGDVEIKSIKEEENFDIKIHIKQEQGYFSFTFSNDKLLSETNANMIEYLTDMNKLFMDYFDHYVRSFI